MNTQSILKKNLILMPFMLVAASIAAPAAILLEVDISNPAAVVIRSTDANPITNSNTFNNFLGVTLLQFLASDSVISGLIPTATLTANHAEDAYNEWWITELNSGRLDLNLYFDSEADATPQQFNTAQPAFTGAATLNMSSAFAALPSIGHTGNIIAGDATLTGPVIGQFLVIPEPSAILLLSTTSLLALRRHRVPQQSNLPSL